MGQMCIVQLEKTAMFAWRSSGDWSFITEKNWCEKTHRIQLREGGREGGTMEQTSLL